MTVGGSEKKYLPVTKHSELCFRMGASDVVAQQGHAQGPEWRHSVAFVSLMQPSADGFFLKRYNNVTFTDGYYHILVGSVNRLDGNLFTQPELYYAMTIDDGDELQPPVPFTKVPIAMRADIALDVQGNINPTSVTINDRLVLDDEASGLLASWSAIPLGHRVMQVSRLTRTCRSTGTARRSGCDTDTRTGVAKVRTVDGSTAAWMRLARRFDKRSILARRWEWKRIRLLTVGGGLSVNAGNCNLATINQNGLTVWPLDDNADGGFSLQGAGNFSTGPFKSSGNLRLMEPQDSVGDGRDHGNFRLCVPEMGTLSTYPLMAIFRLTVFKPKGWHQ